jgi:RND family efflux transporter MFP subunit
MNGFRSNFVVLLSAATLALAGCTSKSPEPVAPSVVTGLAVAQTHLEQMPNTMDAIGTVHAKESAVLSAQVMGRVTSVAVHEGDSVRAGQTLVALDNAQARSDVERSRAAVASSEQEVQVAQTEASLASSTLKRYELLRERKTVSPQEFDEIQRRSQAAAARVESARSQVQAARAAETGAGTVADYARLSAPFAGIVTARHVDPGAMATPGMPLLEVEKAGTLQLNATVDESLVRSLQKGMSVPVEIAALSSQSLHGRIAEIVPAADPASHSFLVKIDLPAAAGLRSGMFGTARIGSGSHSALLVPLPALVTHGSLNGVWVLDVNRLASLRYVTLGTKHDDNIEVLSGLSAGETVVLSPGDRELGGNKIEVRQ